MYRANSDPVNSVSSRSCRLELLIVLSMLGWLWNRGGKAAGEASGLSVGLTGGLCGEENNPFLPSFSRLASNPIKRISAL